MDIDQLRQVLELVRQHDVRDLEIESEGLRLRVRTDAAPGRPFQPAIPEAATPAAPAAAPVYPVPVAPSASAPPLPPAPAPEAPAAPAVDAADLVIVLSPIVGTFYRAPEPGAKPFVDVGQRVRRGQVLCIIEAMKLMNEIESEYAGEVVSVFPENGQPIQYGERLFAIRKG